MCQHTRSLHCQPTCLHWLTSIEPTLLVICIVITLLLFESVRDLSTSIHSVKQQHRNDQLDSLSWFKSIDSLIVAPSLVLESGLHTYCRSLLCCVVQKSLMFDSNSITLLCM